MLEKYLWFIVKACLIIPLIFFLNRNVYAEISSDSSRIKWKKYVHLDFELMMPVSRANFRPVSVPEKATVFKQLVPSLSLYDLLEYRGANEEFYCTVQLTTYEQPLSVEGMSTKLFQTLKSDYQEVKDKKLVYDKLERIGEQRKLQLIYSGDKEVYTIIAYVNSKRVIMILLSDVSSNQKWTKRFLKDFKLRN